MKQKQTSQNEYSIINLIILYVAYKYKYFSVLKIDQANFYQQKESGLVSTGSSSVVAPIRTIAPKLCGFPFWLKGLSGSCTLA
jgi:hypothetical protein